MSENENIKEQPENVEQTTVEQPAVDDTAVQETEIALEVSTNETNEKQVSKGQKVKAAVKEWFRKRIVKLKHKPQTIPFVILLITSFMFLCFLGTTSKFIDTNRSIKSLGLFQFVNTLASILILLVFLNAFPKRKKVNIVMLVLTFVVLALMIVMDILFIVNIADYANNLGIKNGFEWFLKREGTSESINCCIVHIVFVAITAIILALLPLIKKLLLKINTSKELASNNINEKIDTSESDG